MSEVHTPEIISEREIIIYTTRGGKLEKVTTAVKTWGELKPIVSRLGYDLRSLDAAENITRHDLINDQAILPATAFRLFLRPKEVKSGAGLPYKEVRGKIQQAMVDNEEAAREHFNQEKNYTTKKGDELNELWDSYAHKGTYASKSNVSTPKKEKPLKEEAEVKKQAPVKEEPKEEPKEASKELKEVVQAVAEAKTSEVSEASDLERAEKALSLVYTLPESEDKDFAIDALTSIVDTLTILAQPEPEEVKETEEQALAREAKEMMNGYR